MVNTPIIAAQPANRFPTSLCEIEINEKWASRAVPSRSRVIIHHFIAAERVIVNIAEISARIFGNQIQIEAHQFVADINQGGNGAPDFQQFAFELINLLGGFAAGYAAEYFFLDGIQFLLETLHHRKVLIHNVIH